jgi:hypothetical protein
MEGGHMLNKLHTKSTMKQQDQASKDKSDALLCRVETRKTKSKPIEMHSHVMCLQTIENKSMLMHSNHRPKPMLPIMKLKQIQKNSPQIFTIVDKPEAKQWAKQKLQKSNHSKLHAQVHVHHQNQHNHQIKTQTKQNKPNPLILSSPTSLQ